MKYQHLLIQNHVLLIKTIDFAPDDDGRTGRTDRGGRRRRDGRQTDAGHDRGRRRRTTDDDDGRTAYNFH
jgi:hypothetical protein